MHGVRMNSFFRLPQALLAAAVLASMTAMAQPIKLGELNSYKTFPAFLEPYKKGMELAVEEINAGGGVLGRPLELVTRDDNGNAGDAVRVAEELLAREKVDALMGTFSSAVGLAVADFARQRRAFFLAAEQIDHGPIAEQPAQLAFAYELGEVRREQRRENGVGLCLEQRLHDRSGVDLAEWNRDLDELDRR